MRNPEILEAPRPGKEKKFRTDASAHGLGEGFLQASDEGWRPVALISKLLKKTNLLYAAEEKECLVRVHELRKLRIYLHGEKIVVVTDQLSLKWLLSLQKHRDRLTRWAISIQELDF